LALARQERLDHLIPSTDRWWGRSQFATHAGKLERRPGGSRPPAGPLDL